MEARILGAHQCETFDRRFTSMVIDGVLAIDAGSLAGGLSLSDQLNVRDVLITHHHWDHVKDLAGFGFNLLGARASARIYCTDEVLRVVSGYVLNPAYWIDFFKRPEPENPVYVHVRLEPDSTFAVGPYQVQAIAVNHSVPTTGYQVTGPAGRALYYTGDNGPGCGRHWVAATPDVLVTEVTYPNELATEAARAGHLWPDQLEAELTLFRDTRGYIPRVLVVHVNPFHEDQVRAEVAEVAGRLGAVIDVAWEGLVISV